MSADISDSSFLLDSLSNAKIFPNFSFQQEIVLYFLTDFWNLRFSGRCHFIVTLFLLEKHQYSYLELFWFFCIKVITFLFKMEKFMLFNFNCPCVQNFSSLIAWRIHPLENGSSTNPMNLQLAPAHKMVMKDDNWFQNFLNLLVFIFLILMTAT